MDPQKVWRKLQENLKSNLSPASFRTWFSGVDVVSLNEDKMILSVPSAFIKENIQPRYQDLIEETLVQIISKKIIVDFTIDSSKKIKPQRDESEESFFIPQQSVVSILNPKYTMENFVVGLSNNVAFAAAQAVVQNPGLSYNPLFIYGGTGVGKTHLMLAIGNAILKKRPSTNIIYCSSEKFMNDYVAAIQNHKMADLRAKYRSTQALLVDDIQFFSGREGTQEEFFHTFNELQSKNCQMVLTSDRPPNEMAKLEERLKSRFAGGLMVDIQPPDFDTRMAILRSKSTERGQALPEESLRLIASSSQSNIRELEGKLAQIVQILSTQNLPVTPENITPYLDKPSSKPLTYDHKQVLSAICGYFNLKVRDLTGPRRQKELVLPRHISMYILSEELGITVEKIGQILGGRDHTTVMHGRDRIKKLLNADREVQKMFIEIKSSMA